MCQCILRDTNARIGELNNRIIRTTDYPAQFDPELFFRFAECDHIEVPAHVVWQEE